MNNQTVYIVPDDEMENVVGGASAIEYGDIFAILSLTVGQRAPDGVLEKIADHLLGE